MLFALPSGIYRRHRTKTADEWVTILHIPEVRGSNISRQTSYPVCRGFPQLPQAIAPHMRLRTVPSTSLPIHYSLIILQYGCTVWDTGSFVKRNINELMKWWFRSEKWRCVPGLMSRDLSVLRSVVFFRSSWRWSGTKFLRNVGTSNPASRDWRP